MNTDGRTSTELCVVEKNFGRDWWFLFHPGGVWDGDSVYLRQGTEIKYKQYHK